MGTWGVKALESDEGLDMLHYFDVAVRLKKFRDMKAIMGYFVKEGLLGEEPMEDYLGDHMAMGLAELLIEYQVKQGLELHYFDKEDKQQIYLLTGLKWSKEDLVTLNAYLIHILDPKEEHELYELWEDSDSFEQWKGHLKGLIEQLEQMADAV